MMKRTWITIALAGCFATAAPALAQSTRAVPAAPGAAVGGNAVTYSLPQTVISVSVTVQQETIKRGPYARYAQQYLGTVAHLSDKEIYTILGATMSYASEADPAAVYVLDSPEKSPFDLYYPTPEGFIAHDGQSHPRFAPGSPGHPAQVEPAAGFEGIPVDKMSLSEPALEEAAAEAARTLFTLRKRRFDLVTGEAGENVYGAGMEAALAEMKRLEDEYTALFLGKRTVRRITRTYDVVPEAGKNTLIVCRFNETGGLLPEGDLSGRPIVVNLMPENKAANTVNRATGRDARGTIFMRIADIVRCQVMDDKTVLASERIPVYQFGQTVEVPVSSAKKPSRSFILTKINTK